MDHSSDTSGALHPHHHLTCQIQNEPCEMCSSDLNKRVSVNCTQAAQKEPPAAKEKVKQPNFAFKRTEQMCPVMENFTADAGGGGIQQPAHEIQMCSMHLGGPLLSGALFGGMCSLVLVCNSCCHIVVGIQITLNMPCAQYTGSRYCVTLAVTFASHALLASVFHSQYQIASAAGSELISKIPPSRSFGHLHSNCGRRMIPPPPPSSSCIATVFGSCPQHKQG